MNTYTLKSALLVTSISLVFTVAARAVDPPPDGGYPNQNTAEGDNALFSLTSGSQNTAVGWDALFSTTSAFANTATGYQALRNNTFGDGNTATGSSALPKNTTGNNNTADGAGALGFNISGSENTAVGLNALLHNRNSDNNTGVGTDVLFFSIGSGNTAVGSEALNSNRIGDGNTAIGVFALSGNITGNNNIAVGPRAGENLTTGDSNIAIGNFGREGDSATIRIGRTQDQTATFIAGISGATVPTGVAVIVDADGHLGTMTSSKHFKKAIRPMNESSEVIFSLKPVTFRYQDEIDPTGIPQFGLVAEEVEHVDPDLVARDAGGKPYSVRYEAVNAMLLNEFLKEHRKVESLERSLKGQQQRIDALEAALKKQLAPSEE